MGLVEVRVVVQAALRSGREVSFTFALAVGRGKRLSQSQVRPRRTFSERNCFTGKNGRFLNDIRSVDRKKGEERKRKFSIMGISSLNRFAV